MKFTEEKQCVLKPFCQQTMEKPSMTKGRCSSDEDRQSTILMVTPLSVLIRDQIGKMRGCGGKLVYN